MLRVAWAGAAGGWGGEPETTVDTDEGYGRVEWHGSSHDGVGLLLYADSTKLRVSVTEDLLLSSPQLCPPVSWASDTRTLIVPHKQALPVCHSLTGPGSHLDSSLPLTVSARANNHQILQTLPPKDLSSTPTSHAATVLSTPPWSLSIHL